MDNPDYGVMIESYYHKYFSYEYNLWWDAFFSFDDVTKNDALAVAEFLSKIFGYIIDIR